MKPIKKLFVSDMDGTFLDKQGSYDRKRLEALLDDFDRRGYGFAVASGRGLLALDKLFAGLTDRIATIAENGAFVRYQGQVIFEDTMTREEVKKVVQALRANPYLTEDKYLLSGQRGSYATQQAAATYVADLAHYYENLQQVDDLLAVDDNIYKLTAQFTKDTLLDGIAAFNQQATGFVAVAVGDDSVDIIRQGSNKAFGLTQLCHHLGIDRCQVTAFGDNGNDLELMSQVGQAIAVANAIPAIKERASQVIGHHETGAVLTYLEQAVADIRLLALDLDGTLFTTDKQVSPENKAALRLAKEKGVKIVITTGRPLKAIGNLLEELGLQGRDQYSITFNGGLVQRNDGTVLAHHPMSMDEIAQVQAVMAQLALPVDVISDGTVYSIPGQGKTSLYHTANPMLDFIQLDSLADLPKDKVYNKIVIVCEADYLDERIAQLPASLSQQFEVFKSREIILEVMPKGVHKAQGLADLCQELGASPHQVMAMGDEENDLTMLAWAGWGVAMGNAVPAAKAAARLSVTRTNDQSGVAEAIYRYIVKEEMTDGIV